MFSKFQIELNNFYQKIINGFFLLLNKKFNLILILVLILPISFVIGPLIVETIALILILYLLYTNLQSKDFIFVKNKIFIFFLIFYLFLIFSLFFTDYYLEVSVNIIFYIRFILFAFGLSLFLNSDIKNLNKIYFCFFFFNFDYNFRWLLAVFL